MSIEKFLRRHLPYKEIGWQEVGEVFTRYSLWRTRWFNIYIHQLYAPQWHPECHDHPWSFISLLLWRGYTERIPWKSKQVAPVIFVNGVIVDMNMTREVRRYPGQILYRPATFLHNVITPKGTSWSLIFTAPKSRDWGFRPCNRLELTNKSYQDYIREHESK